MSKIPEISNSNKPPKIVNESEVVGNHKGLLSCCSFFGSEHQILTAGSDCDLILWDVESGSELSKLSGHDGTVLNFSVSPTDMCRLVASSSIDKSVRIWDMRSNKTVQIFDQHDYNVNCVEFLRTGESIISGSDDAKCRFFDLRSDKLIGVYQKNSVLFGVNDLDVSSSGRILFSGHHDGTINVWDTLKFCRLQITYGHDERISCLKTSPDGLALATSSWDSTIKVWS
ncbi:hypothetical protein A3Q56_03855 [Intoshia linei]|uniref:Uncharacterized protein n=1 Tax=Intoshia linei TaxID=1819745 RepID=A0A177B4Q3_9BILA|nr:hypothetical protein A3Q56_03855 [Intoshia linei]